MKSAPELNGHANGKPRSSSNTHFVPELNQELIRITHVANKADKGEGFLRWAMKFDSYNDMRQESNDKADQGKMGHAIIAKLVTGQRVQYDRTIPELVWEKAYCFETFWQKQNATLIASEQMIFHDKLLVAGHPDLVHQTGRRECVSDIKFGKGPYPSMFMQVEAYSRICEEQYGCRNLLRSLVFLDPEKYDEGVNHIQWERDDEAWEGFLGLLAYTRFEEALKLRGKKKRI